MVLFLAPAASHAATLVVRFAEAVAAGRLPPATVSLFSPEPPSEQSEVSALLAALHDGGAGLRVLVTCGWLAESSLPAPAGLLAVVDSGCDFKPVQSADEAAAGWLAAEQPPMITAGATTTAIATRRAFAAKAGASYQSLRCAPASSEAGEQGAVGAPTVRPGRGV